MEEKNDENKSRIERLKRGLYSRKNPDIIDIKEKEKFVDDSLIVSDRWQEREQNKFDELVNKFTKPLNNGRRYANKIFIAALLFFCFSIGVAIFVFWGGVNMVSSKNVDIKIAGPISVSSGQETSFEIIIINGNRTDLNSVILNLEYPEGFLIQGNSDPEAVSQRFELGIIKTGDQKSQTVKTFIFGEKDEIKDIKISVEYKVENSNATFFKEKKHQILIGSSSLIVTPTYPKEVNSNQEITLSLEIASNSKETMEDFLISVDYPFGFVFRSATPDPFYDSKTWLISDLKSNSKKTIEIRGNIVGQDGEERIFRINTGTPNEDDGRKIKTILTSSKESIFIKESFIGIRFDVNGESGDYVYRSGDLNGALVIKNNLSDKIFNSLVEVNFQGNGFSEKGVKTGQNGFFRSIDDTILWDSRAVPRLGEIDPLEEIILSFNLVPISYYNTKNNLPPEIKIKVTVQGDRILDTGAVEKVESIREKTIKFATDLSLTQKITRTQGNIENSGFIPPSVENKTTYTAVWSLTNSFNNASNLEIKAVLPPYVEWTGVKEPKDENIIFDSTTKQVVWRVPQVLAGTGYGLMAKEVMFQISFTPSRSQVGTEPVLIEEAYLTGIDKATGISLSDKVPAVTTKFLSDPSYRAGNEKVVE